MKRYATSLAELAAVLDKSVGSLQKYGHLGCPCTSRDKDSRGRYSVSKVRKWMAENGYLETRRGQPKVEQGDLFDGTPTARLKTAQAEERQHKAELARLELETRRGEVMRVEDVHAEWRKRHVFVRDTLQNWKRSLAPVLAGKTAPEILAIMDERIDALLRQFSGQDEKGET